MKLSIGKLSVWKLTTGLLFVSFTAGSALAQIPSVVQHVQDQMNGIQQQKKAASDAALNGSASANAPVGKPAAATAAKPTTTLASAKSATVAVQKSPVSPVASKPAVATAKPAVAAGPVAAKAVPATQAAPTTKAAVPAKHDPFAKTVAPKVTAQKTIAPKMSPKPAAPTASVAKTPGGKPDTKTAAAKPAEAASAETPGESKEEAAEKKKESGFITAGSRRDPFVSPIVQHMTGTGCSTGKRCLAIDQIALRGIVKSDGGMIAVVVNSLDKAYFLRENDPVFNGYVLKISGDSVVFKETVQDKLGHLSTREVVKKITTPAV